MNKVLEYTNIALLPLNHLLTIILTVAPVAKVKI